MMRHVAYQLSLILIISVTASAFLFLQACADGKGGSGSAGISGSVSYSLERKFTDQSTNVLNMSGSDPELYFTIEGEGFGADVPLGKKQPMRGATTLRFTDERKYELQLTVFQADGTVYLTDYLQWTKSATVPTTPKIGFNEVATEDLYVKLLLVPPIDENTNSVWVEGDIGGDMPPTGTWYDMPASLRMNLQLTPGDGEKKVRVKVRNRFQAESEMVQAKIVLNTTIPKFCKSAPVAPVTSTAFVKFQVNGTDDFHTFYRVFGDTKDKDNFIEFSGETMFTVQLNIADASKVQKNIINVQVKDKAENFCPMMKHEITYDPAHIAGGVTIRDNKLWSDSEEVTVDLNYEHFAEEAVEMYIDGGIEDDANTFEWVPFQDSMTVKLQTYSGYRFIYVRFRDAYSTQSRKQYVGIYLRPYAYLVRSSGGSTNLSLANIPGLTGITVTGCAETYTNVAFGTQKPCTPTGGTVDVLYLLQDGDQILRTITVR